MKNSKYWIAFSSIEQIDSAFIKRLYNYSGDIKTAFEYGIKELSQIEGLSVKKAENFVKYRDKTDPDKALQTVIERGIKFYTLDDEKYPQMLYNIDNPPAVLYYRGDVESCNLNRTLAVVGSRRASSYAKSALTKILTGLKGTDICIVSGLAAGIDTTAHTAALSGNLKTIGVIASGFDFIYPTANKQLYEKIQNGNGAVVSEYFPTFEPVKFRFPQRNRIVSGLSFGTLVAEASLKSGALITANLTLEQGRELMCMPGLITNPNTEGIYKLLKNGASLVTCFEDILNALNWEIKKEPLEAGQTELAPDEEKILSAIEIEEKGFDELLAITKIDVDTLLTSLTMLELKGIIKQVNGDRYGKI